MRPGNLVRASLAVGLAIVAIAGFLRPFEPAPRRTRAPAATVEPRSPEGFLLTDAPRLLERVRRSRAKGILVSAWASWCGSCKEELPMLLSLDKTFDPSSIEVLLVTVDEPEARPDAAEMLAGFGARTPSYAVEGPLEAFKAGIDPRWPGMLPATFLFDPSGKLRYFWGGPVFEDELGPLLRRYLAGEHIDGEANFALAPGAVTH